MPLRIKNCYPALQASKSVEAIWTGKLGDLADDQAKLRISAELTGRYERHFGRRPSSSEVQSWWNTLEALQTTLPDLPTVGIALELFMPHASYRADVGLFGNSADGTPNCIILEMKQWQHMERKRGGLVRGTSLMGEQRIQDPFDQAKGYVSYIQSQVVTGPNFPTLHPAAWLPFAKNLKIPVHATIFGANDSTRIKNWVRTLVGYGDGRLVRDQVLDAPIVPAPHLKELVEQIAQRRHLPLLGQQFMVRDAFDTACNALKNQERTLILVEGGPGSGKTLLALHLAIRCSTYHGLKPPTLAYGSKAMVKALDEMSSGDHYVLRYFNNGNKTSVLIADEAHRIRHGPNDRFAGLEALMENAGVVVLLQDEHQVINSDEGLGVTEIEGYALKRNWKFSLHQLDGTWRHGGSLSFEAWLDELLHVKQGNCPIWRGDSSFELVVCNDEHELAALLEDWQMKGETVRVMAGDDQFIANKLHIGNTTLFKHRTSNHRGYHQWALEEEHGNDVGTFWNAQGFEFDRAVVVVGQDLIFSYDAMDWHSTSQVATELVRNRYRVLLTRARKGVAILFVNPEARMHARSRLSTIPHRAE